MLYEIFTYLMNFKCICINEWSSFSENAIDREWGGYL